jgi:NADH:ubiquinone oxidoreductase subunit 5 (subunit L)/multisubunit Na+/H+ antiporter MnhA subunit
MPLAANAFLVGAVAICGLPPLNGFASEFLIYLGALNGEVTMTPAGSVPALVVLVALALIGGLAVACFTKAFGVVFLGEPRTNHARQAQSQGVLMIAPLLVLGAACLAIGVAAPWLTYRMLPVVAAVVRQSPQEISEALAIATAPLSAVVLVTGGLLLAVLGLTLARKLLLWRRQIGSTVTWDCGYAHPTARMQYTSSSFAQPITGFFIHVLRTRRKLVPPHGLFPDEASLHTETPDVSLEGVYRPLFAQLCRLSVKLHWIQHGQLNNYVLYIALTILVLLVWFLGVRP